MTEHNVKIRIITEVQEALSEDEPFGRQWKGLMYIEGTSHEFHTSGTTANMVIEIIGIELVSILKAQYHKEEKQNGN
ncbi:hypothetical protein KAX02_06385 [candidate division WOR-3 bacterium]|nr:hypothetical protein [candidate division WOR-3 bacterium]